MLTVTTTENPIADECSGVCEPVDHSDIINADGKNQKNIVCRRCQSPIFPSNVVTIVNEPMKDLKNMSVGSVIDNGFETITDWWYTENDYVFDTVGWQTVEGVKALVCGDCEFGPFGWRTDDNKKFYVAVERVKYIP